MLSKIVYTIGSRLFMALANVALLLITTRIMGAEVKGQISLFILNISLVTMVSGVFAGPSLVYLVPRQNKGALLFLAYAWSVIAAVGLTLFIHFYSLDAGEPMLVFFAIALLECLLAAHLMTLLGSERIRDHNLLQMLKPFLTVALLLFNIRVLEDRTLSAFLWAYGMANILTYLVSSVRILADRRVLAVDDLLQTVKDSWHHGTWIQLGSVAQLLNYRVSYYFLELLTQPPSLALIRIGIYSAAIQIAESLWLLARSVATVQYSRVSNQSERSDSLVLSLKLIKFNYTLTALGCLALVLMPEAFYSLLLGPDFGEVRRLTILLVPGIVFLSISNGISHFFAGVGDNRYNAQSSFFGLLISVGAGYFTVLYFSMWGAAIATSLTYVLQTVYQFRLMMLKDRVGIGALWLNRGDFLEFKSKVKDMFKSGI